MEKEFLSLGSLSIQKKKTDVNSYLQQEALAIVNKHIKNSKLCRRLRARIMLAKVDRGDIDVGKHINGSTELVHGFDH